MEHCSEITASHGHGGHDSNHQQRVDSIRNGRPKEGRDGSVVSLLSPDEAGSIGTITRQLGLSIKQNAKVALELADYRAVTGLTQPEEAEPSVDEVLPLDLSVDKPSAAFGDGWEKF